MFTIDNTTVAPVPPTVPAAGQEGYFTPGDPTTGAVPTKVLDWWLNMIQGEMGHVVTQAAIAFDKTDNTQFYAAIQAIIAPNIPVFVRDRVFVAGVVFEGTVADGDAVRWDAAGNRFAKAVADGTANRAAVGVADVTAAEVTLLGDHSAGIAGLTPGTRQYLDDTTPGALTEAQPADDVVSMGFSKTATDLFVDVDPEKGLVDTSVVGASRNLITANNAANPTYQIDVDADEVVLKDAAGDTVLAAAVNLTVDITASGADGLDAGAEAASTWYYVWAISNGATTAGLLSVSSTAPTLPVGYTYKALVGFVRNDGSSDFETIYVSGRRFAIPASQVVSKLVDFDETWEPASLTAAFPAVARTADGFIGLDPVGGAGMALAVAGDTSGLGAQVIASLRDNPNDPVFGLANGGPFFDIPLPTPQTLYWQAHDQSSTVEIWVAGGTF